MHLKTRCAKKRLDTLTKKWVYRNILLIRVKFSDELNNYQSSRDLMTISISCVSGS